MNMTPMNNDTNSSMHSNPTHKPRPMIDLLVSILIPSIILMKLSGPQELGASGALIIALAFPLGWGMFELLKYRKFNFIALLGLISVLLTGGIGLLQLDPQWLAVKEAASRDHRYRHPYLGLYALSADQDITVQPQGTACRED